jgi:hypothetical protein
MGNEIPDSPLCPGCCDYLPASIYVTFLSDVNQAEGPAINSEEHPCIFTAHLPSLLLYPVSCQVAFCFDGSAQLEALFYDHNYGCSYSFYDLENHCKPTAGGPSPAVAIIF